MAPFPVTLITWCSVEHLLCIAAFLWDTCFRIRFGKKSHCPFLIGVHVYGQSTSETRPWYINYLDYVRQPGKVRQNSAKKVMVPFEESFLPYHSIPIRIDGDIKDARLHQILKKVGSKGKLRYVGMLFPGHFQQGCSTRYIWKGNSYPQFDVSPASPASGTNQYILPSRQNAVQLPHSFAYSIQFPEGWQPAVSIPVHIYHIRNVSYQTVCDITVGGKNNVLMLQILRNRCRRAV